MTDSARSLAQEAAGLVDDAGGLTNFIRDYGIGGILYAVFLAIIGTIEAAGDLILAPFRALAGGIAELVEGTLGETLNVIAGGAQQAVESFGTGATELIGPLAFPFAVAIAMSGVFVFVWFIARIEFSPLVFIRRRVGR